MAKKCMGCGNEISDTAKFCEHCGKEVFKVDQWRLFDYVCNVFTPLTCEGILEYMEIWGRPQEEIEKTKTWLYGDNNLIKQHLSEMYTAYVDNDRKLATTMMMGSALFSPYDPYHLPKDEDDFLYENDYFSKRRDEQRASLRETESEKFFSNRMQDAEVQEAHKGYNEENNIPSEESAREVRNRAMEEEIRRVAQENARNREVNEEAMRAAREAAYEKATVNIEIERIRKSLKWNTALAALFWVVFVYAALYTVGAFSAEQYDLFWDGFFFLVIMSLPGVWIYSTRKKLSAKLQLATVYLAGLEL